MKTIFINTENSKTNEPPKFFLNLSQILVLLSSSKHVALQNFIILFIIIQHGMMNFNCQMVLVLHQIFKITLNTSLKSTKH